MLRTQIYLPEKLYERLYALKKAKDLSVAQIIREILEKNLSQLEENLDNDLLELAKLRITGGPSDLSDNINRYLYEAK